MPSHFNCDGCGLDFIGTPTVENDRGWKWCTSCAEQAFNNSYAAWVTGDPSRYTDEIVEAVGAALAA